MAADNEAKLREQLLEVKSRASQLSGDVDRLKKQLGTEQAKVEELEAVLVENASLKALVKDLEAQLTSALSAAKTAQGLADQAAAGLAAAKQVADGLAKLKSL